MTIGEFIEARLAEDEQVAKRNIGSAPGEANGLGDTADGRPSWPDYQTYDSDDLTAATEYVNSSGRCACSATSRPSDSPWKSTARPPEMTLYAGGAPSTAASPSAARSRIRAARCGYSHCPTATTRTMTRAGSRRIAP